jgi:UDPglucose 6-dehydrogenase
VGRTAKSTTDNFWVIISGADQIEASLWLFPEAERDIILRSVCQQRKRIAPTGYRKEKTAAWVQVVEIKPVPYSGKVYSVEVPATHTVVASNGLIAHNCFPKDTRALVRIAEDAGYDFGLLEGVIEVNVEQYERMVRKIRAAAPGGDVAGCTIAVWGLTFKAMTDDLRDSPSLEVIRRLREAGVAVRAYDPQVDRARAAGDDRLAGITVCDDAYDACTGAALVAVLTEWDELRWLDFEKVGERLATPTVVDCRNLLDPAAMRRRGFAYHAVGRP